MTFGPTAASLYGGGPAIGMGEKPGPALSAVGQGTEAPKPDPRAAPKSSNNLTGITDDPTFWLVATVGVVAALAAASAR